MRENIGPISGTNPSKNGGIDPDDTRTYLRPFYRTLFTRILENMNPKIANVAPPISVDAAKAKKQNAHVTESPQSPQLRVY